MTASGSDERPSDDRFGRKHVEVVDRDPRALDTHRLAIRRRECQRIIAVARKHRERVVIALKIEEVRRGECADCLRRTRGASPAPGSKAWDREEVWSSTPSTTLKIAVLAPIPIASVRMATSAKPGLPTSVRMAYRRSFVIEWPCE